jgi:hypothetical protein
MKGQNYWPCGRAEASAALKASRALARVRQKPFEAGMMGKSGRATSAGRPGPPAASSEMRDQFSNLKKIHIKKPRVY